MDDYEVLGVPRTSSREEIVKAFRLKALELHPDKGGNIEDFQNLQKSYDRIKDTLSIDDLLHRQDPISIQFESKDPFVGLKIVQQEEENGVVVNYVYKFNTDNTVIKEKV